MPLTDLKQAVEALADASRASKDIGADMARMTAAYVSAVERELAEAAGKSWRQPMRGTVTLVIKRRPNTPDVVRWRYTAEQEAVQIEVNRHCGETRDKLVSRGR